MYCTKETNPVLEFCFHFETLLYDESGGTCTFGQVLVCQGHNVKAPVFVCPHVQHWLGSIKLSFSFSEEAYSAGGALVRTSTVPLRTILIKSKNRQNKCVMIHPRFDLSPLFICPLWTPHLNWAFAELWRLTASGVDCTWRWLMQPWTQADSNIHHQ